MLADIEAATKRKLPADFAEHLADATLRRLRAELRATPHMEHALTWLRGPKCVASSSPHRPGAAEPGKHRAVAVLRSLSVLGERRSAAASRRPTCSCYAAAKMRVQPADCIVVEDSPAGVSAAPCRRHDADRLHRRQPHRPDLGAQLTSAGARAVVADMRALKSTVVALRGW